MKLTRWFKDLFLPEEFNGLDTVAIGEAFNDSMVRTFWLASCFEELKRINMEVDKRLLSGSGSEYGLTDLCARRKAFQDVLELILSARRKVATQTQEVRPNPMSRDAVNLDRVTA